MRKLIILLLALGLPLPLLAQQPDSLAAAGESRDSLRVPADFRTETGTFRLGTGVPVDTLDIDDGRLLLVLRDDHTWYYIKNIQRMAADSTFTKDWIPNSTNPYKIPLDSLPLRNSICLVDSASVFVCPNQTKVFSRFGYRHGRRHQGVDLPYKTGTPVVAAFDGRVRVSDYSGGYGNLIVIRHENGLETYYGHLSKREVEVGDWVHAGDQIGLGGSTGRSTGPHLHFETRYKGFAFDPEWIVDFEKGQLRANVFVLRRSYLDAHSHYVPESIDEEDDVYAADEKVIEEEKRRAAERAAARYYTVRSGDTLGAIARKQGKSLNAILKLNPGVNPNKLRIGQKIRVN
ncbi:MAG: peptidoglycan DD-metalloendopeptidase family protein [Bacteroidales bacterium]|nr:peptidoglycan DD-metalloendopeptidase family protein [Bacteroidales bacterium]